MFQFLVMTAAPVLHLTRVYGHGCLRVLSLGLGFRVQGSGFQVEGLWFRA